MADATEIIRAIERGLTQREAVPGMPAEGPYPATTADALAEVRAELATLGLAIVPAECTCPYPNPSPADGHRGCPFHGAEATEWARAAGQLAEDE